MRFRIPKPVKSRRQFFAEVGIIVVGVLIALTAEQGVEALRWRSEVSATEAALDYELRGSIGQGYERYAIDPCLRERIANLAEKLGRPDAEWEGNRLPPRTDGGPVLPQVYRAPSRNWTTDAWEAAVASGVTNHMPRQRASDYAAIYTQISHLGRLQDRENEFSSNLAFLAQTQVLEPRTRVEAIHSLAEIDRINRLMVLIASQMAEAGKELGLNFGDAEWRTALQTMLASQRKLRGNCVRGLPASL